MDAFAQTLFHESPAETRFERFLRDCPDVFPAFVRIALDLRRRGRKRYSADGIAHVIRWEMATSGRDSAGFKINNSHVAMMARKAMAETCRNCKDRNVVLQAHHRFYFKGCRPWEYRLGALVTLCDDCHERITELLDTARKLTGFLAEQELLYLLAILSGDKRFIADRLKFNEWLESRLSGDDPFGFSGEELFEPADHDDL